MKRAVAAALVGVVVGGGCAGRGWLGGDDRVARGERLFVQKGCNGCHTIGVVGTPIGPPLEHIGSAHDERWLVAWLQDPAAQRPRAHMPRIAFARDEAEPLAAYLATLR
jgi:cbb3-type cytochrome oxidase cytochrome c subunit